jgi:aryl-alcohol dehydrogenase-like predicted oxidoreductase
VECGAFNTLQTSISIADQEAIEVIMPLAHKKQMGVIAKRPIANAAWKTGHKPIQGYHHGVLGAIAKIELRIPAQH